MWRTSPHHTQQRREGILMAIPLRRDPAHRHSLGLRPGVVHRRRRPRKHVHPAALRQRQAANDAVPSDNRQYEAADVLASMYATSSSQRPGRTPGISRSWSRAAGSTTYRGRRALAVLSVCSVDTPLRCLHLESSRTRVGTTSRAWTSPLRSQSPLRRRAAVGTFKSTRGDALGAAEKNRQRRRSW